MIIEIFVFKGVQFCKVYEVSNAVQAYVIKSNNTKCRRRSVKKQKIKKKKPKRSVENLLLLPKKHGFR